MEEEKNKKLSIVDDEKFMEFLTDNFGEIKNRLEDVESDVGILKTTMVTKSYLDEKIADLRGDFVVNIKKEDEKVEKIVDKLENKKIFYPKDVEEIKSINIFAKTV
jgi:hypothetical protein